MDSNKKLLIASPFAMMFLLGIIIHTVEKIQYNRMKVAESKAIVHLRKIYPDCELLSIHPTSWPGEADEAFTVNISLNNVFYYIDITENGKVICEELDTQCAEASTLLKSL